MCQINVVEKKCKVAENTLNGQWTPSLDKDR